MKKTLLLTSFVVLSAAAAFAQVGLDSASNFATPVTPPPPPPPPAVISEPAAPAYVPPLPAQTTTTTTVITQPATAASTTPAPTYVPRDRSIDVNRIRFGAYVAPDISWMKPTTATDDEKAYDVKSDGSKVGFIYGLMADYFFAENYGIVTGLQINSTGGKITATARDQSKAKDKVTKATFDYRLQYLEVPLALKLRTDDVSGFRFFGQLGVTAGFNISKKADYTVDYFGSDSTAKTVSDTKAKLQGGFGLIAPILFQMNIGAGMEYPFSNKLTAYIGLFFNNGFAPDATKPDLYKDLGYTGEFRDANTRLNNFALRIGLFF